MSPPKIENFMINHFEFLVFLSSVRVCRILRNWAKKPKTNFEFTPAPQGKIMFFKETIAAKSTKTGHVYVVPTNVRPK